MAAQTNLVVKKDDGVTDVTFTAINGSTGTNPAVWRDESLGSASGHRSELKISARNGQGNLTRRIRITFAYPQLVTDSTTGITSVHRKSIFDGEFSFPVDMAQTSVNEAISQFANLMDETNVKNQFKSGFAAT